MRTACNLGSIATGELFRAAIKGGTALGQKIHAVYDRGELVPDDLTIALVEERLDQLAQERSRGAGSTERSMTASAHHRSGRCAGRSCGRAVKS